MLNHAEELLKVKVSHGCWGEPEYDYPNEDDIKSANMIIQLLTQKD